MKLKSRIVLYTITLIFFILVNTSYYWEAKTGIFSIPIFVILFLTHVSLIVILGLQSYALLKDKVRNKQSLVQTLSLAFVLITTFFYPKGIINFEKLEGKNLLVAIRKGSANCTSNLKLKDDNEFSLRTYCFGIDETSGKYYLLHDTIFFDKVSISRREEKPYEFALIKPSVFRDSSKYSDIILFKNKNDTTGYIMLITTNNLLQLKQSSLTQ